MSYVESIYIYSPNDILELESKELRRCNLIGPKDRNIKLSIAKLEVPEKVEYNISNLTIDNETIKKLGSQNSITLTDCKLQNLEVLKFLMERKYRELNQVTFEEENIIINTSEAIEKNYKINIDCKKVKEITQELLDKISTISKENEELTLAFSIEQLKTIQENALKIDSKASSIVIIENASELAFEEINQMIEQANLKFVKITPKENENSSYSHHIYEVKEYQKSREILDKILEGLDKNEPDKAKLFAEIYKRLAFHMKYDHDAIEDTKLKEERKVISRNLVGGLVEGKCVCAGYAEILRNACEIMGIEARYVESKENLTIDENGEIDGMAHAYVQVKIDGVWYNSDLTWDRDNIVNGKLPEYFLKSDIDFVKMGRPDKNGRYNVIRTHVPRDKQKFDKVKENYPEEKIVEYFSEEKQPKYLVTDRSAFKDRPFETPELSIKNALEKAHAKEQTVNLKLNSKTKSNITMTTNPGKASAKNPLKHKFYQTDLVDEQAVLYPDGKNGAAIGIEQLNSMSLSETELVTKELLQDRAKGNFSEKTRISENIEEIRKIGNGSLAKGCALLGMGGASWGVIGATMLNGSELGMQSEVAQKFLENSIAIGKNILPIYLGALAVETAKEFEIHLYNSPEARNLRSKLGISPDPRKLRHSLSKSSNRMIKTFSTKKANPRTPIKYISQKNDKLLYTMLGNHIPYKPEMDSAIEQSFLENELQLRSVELCDGVQYKNGTLEENLFNGDVFIAKYWKTKNHPNPTNAYEIENYETHKDDRDNINSNDASEREVIAYYKRDSKGKLYMFGMGDKDNTVFYDLEEPLSVESSKIKKGAQKEITKAEEIMGLEIKKRMMKQMLYEEREVYTTEQTGTYSSTARAWVDKEIVEGNIKDIIKIDGEILGYPETATQKSKDGMKRDKNTAFFLVSVENKVKENYYFVDSNYSYSKVKIGYNPVFGNLKPLSNENDSIFVNVSTDKNKTKFEERKILAEFESTGFDENGNPSSKKRIAITRNENGRLQTIEPYGEENGKRYAALLPQTICIDGRVREKYAARHQAETKSFSRLDVDKYFKPEFKAAASVARSRVQNAYDDYGITPEDIKKQKNKIMDLVNGIIKGLTENLEKSKRGNDEYGRE